MSDDAIVLIWIEGYYKLAANDKYLNILHSCKVAEITTRNGRMRDVGNKECITEERANRQQWLFFNTTKIREEYSSSIRIEFYISVTASLIARKISIVFYCDNFIIINRYVLYMHMLEYSFESNNYKLSYVSLSYLTSWLWVYNYICIKFIYASLYNTIALSLYMQLFFVKQKNIITY